MNHSPLACLRQKARQACDAVRRVTIRHSLHGHCGIYKSNRERFPMSSLRIDCDGSCPLIRVLAVVSIVLLIAMALGAMCHPQMRRARGWMHRCK